MRFCKQRDNYSCGAIAALNVDKVRGYRVTYHDLPYYQDLVRCQKERRGTYASNVSRVFGRACRRSWKSAKEFLMSGNCIIILVRQKRWGHFYLMTTDEHGYIVVVNKERGVHYPSTVQIVPQAAATLLRHARRTWYVEKDMRLM